MSFSAVATIFSPLLYKGDYARDRVLLRSRVPTVRFVARDCLERPQEVVAEVLAILTRQ